MVRVFKCVLGVGLQLYRRCKVVIQFFQMVCIHALTLHIITIRIRSRSSEPSSSRRCPRLQKRRKEVNQDKAPTRTSSWSVTFQIGRKASTGASTPTNFLTITVIFHIIAYECLSLGIVWNSFDACSTSLI